jgi:hypothetical protein
MVIFKAYLFEMSIKEEPPPPGISLGANQTKRRDPDYLKFATACSSWMLPIYVERSI